MDEKLVILEIQKYFKELFKEGLSPEGAAALIKMKLNLLAIKAIETIND